MKLDGVVTLVDAKHVTQHIEEVKPEGIVNEAVEQIAYADRIILNKVRSLSWRNLVCSLGSLPLLLVDQLQSRFLAYAPVILMYQTDLVGEAELNTLSRQIKVRF